MNLLILTETDIISENRFQVTGPRHLHILSVLKPQTGDMLSIGFLNGARGVGRLLSIDTDQTVIEPVELTAPPAPSLSIDLICAIPRPKILRKVLYVSGMFGVRSVHLVRTNRTEKSYLLSPLMEPAKQLPYLLEGMSQGSGHDFRESRFTRYSGPSWRIACLPFPDLPSHPNSWPTWSRGNG